MPNTGSNLAGPHTAVRPHSGLECSPSPRDNQCSPSPRDNPCSLSPRANRCSRGSTNQYSRGSTRFHVLRALVPPLHIRPLCRLCSAPVLAHILVEGSSAAGHCTRGRDTVQLGDVIPVKLGNVIKPGVMIPVKLGDVIPVKLGDVIPVKLGDELLDVGGVRSDRGPRRRDAPEGPVRRVEAPALPRRFRLLSQTMTMGSLTMSAASKRPHCRAAFDYSH